MLAKKHSGNITSYDLLKTFAVIIMIIDHIGFYFFPEQEWWRALGRLCVPIWFFLVGYARTRFIPKTWIFGCLILVFANIITGMSIFALNVLATMIAVRLILDPVMRIVIKSSLHSWMTVILLFILVFPTDFISEYGAQGLLAAMYGYLVRSKDSLKDKNLVINFMLYSFFVFIFYQQITFGFSTWPMNFMIFGTLIVNLYLLSFSSISYPVLTQKTPKPLVRFFHFCGHRTLEVYVVHLVLFKFMALFLGMEMFGWFDLKLYDDKAFFIQLIGLFFK